MVFFILVKVNHREDGCGHVMSGQKVGCEDM
jgi:hypothetical protein